MIIVFILGYVLIGILIQLLVRITLKENVLKLGYKAADGVLFKHIDDKGDLLDDIKNGMSDEDEEKFNTVMYDPRYVIINILLWPFNVAMCIVYVIRVLKILK